MLVFITGPSAKSCAAVEHELERREWAERFATRPETDLGVTAASLVEEARRELDVRRE